MKNVVLRKMDIVCESEKDYDIDLECVLSKV